MDVALGDLVGTFRALSPIDGQLDIELEGRVMKARTVTTENFGKCSGPVAQHSISMDLDDARCLGQMELDVGPIIGLFNAELPFMVVLTSSCNFIQQQMWVMVHAVWVFLWSRRICVGANPFDGTDFDGACVGMTELGPAVSLRYLQRDPMVMWRPTGRYQTSTNQTQIGDHCLRGEPSQ